MDYSGLINLALVTIIYSTFIAPNLKKLASIRDEIANTEFPLINSEEEGNQEAIELVGVAFNKKMTQYESKYEEVQKYLKYFYGILVVLFIVQVSILLHSKSYYFNPMVSLVAAALVVILLILTLNTHLVKPWRIRSIPWLSGVGIAPAYTSLLFEPKLSVNKITLNVINKDGLTRVGLHSNMHFLGYWFILTIESDNGDRLYYLMAGDMSKHTSAGSIVNTNGLETTYTYLAKTNLKDNSYKARLQIYVAPFNGNFKVCEKVVPFEVVNSVATPKESAINLDSPLADYTFDVTKKHISDISFKEGRSGDKSIVQVLSSKNFIRSFKNHSRAIIIEDRNGALDQKTIDEYCSRKNIMYRKFRRLLIPNSRRSVHLKLNSSSKRTN